MTIWVVAEHSESVEELTGEHRSHISLVGYATSEKEAIKWVKSHSPVKGYFTRFVSYDIEEITPLEK